MGTETSLRQHSSARRQAAESLLEAVPRLMRLISAAAQADGCDSALSLAQLRGLALLLSGRRLPSELARDLQVSPATASEMVESLVRRGLVVRGGRRDDRRLTLLTLTPEGERQLAASRERSLGAAESVLVRLNPEETEALHSALLCLLRGLRESTVSRGTGQHAG